jgi:hypothetical protein
LKKGSLGCDEGGAVVFEKEEIQPTAQKWFAQDDTNASQAARGRL